MNGLSKEVKIGRRSMATASSGVVERKLFDATTDRIDRKLSTQARRNVDDERIVRILMTENCCDSKLVDWRIICG